MRDQSAALSSRESLFAAVRRKIEGIAKVGRNRDAARVSGSRIALAPSSPGEARDWRTPQSKVNLTPLLLAYEREREERRQAEKVRAKRAVA